MKPYKRRILLINPKFQLTILIFALSYAVIGMVSMMVFNSLIHPVECFPAPPPAPPEKVWMAIGLIAITLFSAMVVGLVISNRMAGPIFRLKSHMDSIAAGGDVSEVRFREHDYFEDVANSFNKMLAKLRGKGS